MRLPDRLAGALCREEHDVLALVENQSLDQHQPHECFPKSYAVAEEGASVLLRDLHQAAVRLLLIEVETAEHLRPHDVPFVGRQFVTAEVFLERSGVDVERRVFPELALDGLHHFVRDRNTLLPVDLEPLLKLGDLACTLDLYVELDVLSEARLSKIARAHECLGTYDFEPRVGYVRLRVKLVLIVDTALNLAAAQRLQDRGHARQKRILLLVRLHAAVEGVNDTRPYCFQKGPPRAVGGIRAHEDADLVERLPLPVEGQEGPNLEITGSNIERLRDAAPLFEIAQPGPARDAVINDEKIAAGLVTGGGFGFLGHGYLPPEQAGIASA